MRDHNAVRTPNVAERSARRGPVVWVKLLIVLCTTLLVGSVAGPAFADVTTYGGDLSRSAWYSGQGNLVPGLVTGGTFGQMWRTPVTGQVYGQPLVSGGTVFITTEDNNIYGLKEFTGAQQWTRNVGVPYKSSDTGCGDLTPNLGVTATPTIDPATNTAYFFNKTYASGTSGGAAWYAHAVDVATGAERPGFPVLIAGRASNDPSATFNATIQQQRPGLLLMDGVVYAGFGAHCDIGPYKGWIVGVSTSGAMSTMWTATAPGQTGAGVWQSGGGLVSDGPGQIIFSTGNGSSPTVATPGNKPPAGLGESVVRAVVQPDKTLKATDFFTPYDADFLDDYDADLSSGAPVLLPASMGTAKVPRPMLEMGKQGYMVVLDSKDLGGFKQGTAGADRVIQRLGPWGGTWSKPTAWGGDGGYVYITTAVGPGTTPGAGSAAMRALKYGVDGNGNPTFSLVGSTKDAFGFGSSSPVVSSVGTTSGSAIVWVIWSPDGSGNNAQLRAYSPIPVDGSMQQLWSAPIGTASKFAVPTVNNNRVIVGTRSGEVISYGSPVQSAVAASQPTFPSTVVGKSSTAQVTYKTNSALTTTSITPSDPTFTVGAANPPVGTALANGTTVTVPVTFTPTSAKNVSASLTIATTAGNSVVPLSGTGLSPDAQIGATPIALSMGGAVVGRGGISATVTFTNAGAKPLTVNSLTSPSAPFSATGLPAPGTQIPANGSVTSTVSFNPTKQGDFNDAITLSTTGGNLTLPVSASSVPPPVLKVAPENGLDYGTISVGATLQRTVTLTNTGGSPLTITKSKPPITNGFSVVKDIPEGTSIPSGGSVTGVIGFTPTAAGDASSVWTINSNDDNGLRTVPVTGRAVVSTDTTAVNDSDSRITYSSGWGRSTGRGLGDFQDDVTSTTTNGATASFSFTGSGVDVYSERFSDQGLVDFSVDGVLQQTVDTSNPTRRSQQLIFSVQGLAKGAHTIVMTKRNGTYALLDKLVVNNAASTATVTKLNDDAAAVTYAGAGWATFKNRGLGDLNDDTHSTQANGDSVSVAFSGTKIDMYSEKFSDQGQVDVYVDGTFVKTVDTSNGSRQAQQLVFSSGTLAGGGHVLKVVKKTGTWMVIDRFDVTAGSTTPPTSTVTKLNDDAGAVTYAGAGWRVFKDRGLGDLSDDTHSTQGNGDSVSVAFSGTKIDMYSEKFSDQGQVDVYVDGAFVKTVDTSNGSRLAQQLLFSSGTLASGNHVLKVVKKSGTWMVIDRFDVTAGSTTTPPVATVTKLNDDATAVTYAGAGWKTFAKRGLGDLNDDTHSTQGNGDSVLVAFSGTKIDMYSEKFSDQGQVDVYVDGTFVKTVDTSNATRQAQQLLFSSGTLAGGNHELKVVKKSGTWMVIDRFDVAS